MNGVNGLPATSRGFGGRVRVRGWTALAEVGIRIANNWIQHAINHGPGRVLNHVDVEGVSPLAARRNGIVMDSGKNAGEPNEPAAHSVPLEGAVGNADGSSFDDQAVVVRFRLAPGDSFGNDSATYEVLPPERDGRMNVAGDGHSFPTHQGAGQRPAGLHAVLWPRAGPRRSPRKTGAGAPRHNCKLQYVNL